METPHPGSYFGFGEGEALCPNESPSSTDEDSLNATHSVYVDKWDWEKVIPNGKRNSLSKRNSWEDL